MFHICLYQPEIPQNTGNIIRLCANAGANLHIIKPFSFELNDKQLRRAGLDYHDITHLHIHENYAEFKNQCNPKRIFAASTHGKKNYSEVKYEAGDVLLFGPETRGLPKELLAELGDESIIRIPMQPNNRSINLANAVSIVVYEAWRQQGFIGGN